MKQRVFLSCLLGSSLLLGTRAQALAADPVRQQAYLKAADASGGDYFGTDVALAGNTLVVGAAGADNNNGAAYVFVRSGGTWTQQAYLEPTFVTGAGSFGASVAISGDTIAVGAPRERLVGEQGFEDDAGAVTVFVRNGTTWTEQATLTAPVIEELDLFGFSVAVSGDTLVAGSYGESSSATGVDGDPTDNSAPDAGAAHVFVRTGTTWTHDAYLKASNAETLDGFGWSVALRGDTIVVGATGEDSQATGANGNQNDNSYMGSGAAYVFVRSGGSWAQEAYLKPSNTGHFDRFGSSAALAGETLVVGAIDERSNATGVNGNENNNSLNDAGAAYVFVRTGTTWAQEAYLKASNTGADDHFGFSVDVKGDRAVVGAWREDSDSTGVNGDGTNNGASWAGAAYLYERTGTDWSPMAYLKASNTDADDLFGSAVAVSNRMVVVGASEEDSNGTGVNGDQEQGPTFRDVGAAYVFDFPRIPHPDGDARRVSGSLGSRTIDDWQP